VGAKTTPIFLYPEEAGDIRVDVTQLGSSTQSATDLKDFADDGYDPATNKVEGVKLVDTLTTYTGNTVQTGDSFARIGALGAGLTGIPWNAAWDVEVESEVADALLAYDPPTRAEATADKDEILADTNDIQTRLPAALVGGRMDSSVGAMAANVITDAATAADFEAKIADVVWDEALAGHAVAGSAGAALSAAGGAADPWATALPGAYGAGTAGQIIGDFLDVAVSDVKAKTDNLPSDPADASVVAGLIAGLDAKLDTIDNFIDLEIAAIKVKTDQLVFTKAGELDVNVLSINDVTITGDGQVGNEFGV
jgi:hypothetical protein